MRPQKHCISRHFRASKNAVTKARLLKHDFPFHWQFWGRKWVRQFYGRPEKMRSLCGKKTMSIKFLGLGGGFTNTISHDAETFGNCLPLKFTLSRNATTSDLCQGLTVRTLFTGTKRGTAGTVFQKPKLAPEASLSAKLC